VVQKMTEATKLLSSALAGPGPLTELDGATILVVDDEPVNRAVLRANLSGKHKILEAVDGPQALEVLANESVDMVLLDVMMPGISGIDACKQIKAKYSSPFLPVILVTALSDRLDRIAGLEAGADDFLSKPVDRNELRLRIAAFLRIRRQDALIRTQLHDLQHLQRAKEDLISLILHDVRSPLAGQVALLGLVTEELRARDETALCDDLDQAMRSTQQVIDSLEEVLRVRLLEEGALPLKRTKIQLSSLVEDAARTLSGVARAQRSPLRVIIAGDRMVHVDGKLVRRAIENLLSNALRYSPRGAEVVVAVRASDEALEVEVTDCGTGVPDLLKRKLFSKFGSVEAALGSARRGIGLGLYLVRLVVEGHGGAVSIDDRPGGGASFRFWLQTS
jgi:two-component system sensor histidine kinase/response regulator